MPVDIGEAVVAALELVGELLVIDSEKMKQGCLEVVNVDPVFGNVEANIIAGAVGHTGFDPAACHPDGEGVWMMVTTPFFSVVITSLQERGAPELASPNDESVFEQAALL